jgi:hypothetical protein
VPLTVLPLLAVLAMAQARAGGSPSTPPAGPAEPLLGYRGEEVVVRYVPGALDRAVHVAKRLDLVISELRGPLEMAFPLTAIVLSRDEWERKGLTRSYGLPQPLSVGTIAVPASGDAGTVRRWKTWLGTELPDLGGVPLAGTADDASSLMLSDLVLQVEVCELMFERTPVGAADPWIRGLFSHLAAISLWSAFEPARMPEIESVWARMRDQIPPILELETRRQQKGAPPLAMEHWLLSESHLFDGASHAYAAGGAKTFRKLLKTMTKDGKPPTRAQLVAVYPSLAVWIESLPPEAGIL